MVLGAILLWGGIIYFLPPSAPQNYIQAFFLPGQNTVSTKEFHGIPVPALFWLWIFIAALLSKITDLLTRKETITTETISQPLRMCLIAFFVYLYFQTAGQALYFSFHLQHKPEDRLAQFFGKYYSFPQFAKKHLPGKHHCEVRGDWVKKTDADSLGHFILYRYFLYPIDISLNKEAPVDCLLFMYEEGKPPPVPDDFQVIAHYDEQSLIARKK